VLTRPMIQNKSNTPNIAPRIARMILIKFISLF
jgi:hypothetical protein